MPVEWSPWFRLLVAVLATWRIARLIAKEDGPFDLVLRARTRAGGGMVGKLMDCPYCLSLWIAAPAALGIARTPVAWIYAWLAISGGACFLERITEMRGQPPEGE